MLPTFAAAAGFARRGSGTAGLKGKTPNEVVMPAKRADFRSGYGRNLAVRKPAARDRTTVSDRLSQPDYASAFAVPRSASRDVGCKACGGSLLEPGSAVSRR
jgi:hypothetical protein